MKMNKKESLSESKGVAPEEKKAKRRKVNWLAFILCFVVAFFLWLYAKNMEYINQSQNTSVTGASLQTPVGEG